MHVRNAAFEPQAGTLQPEVDQEHLANLNPWLMPEGASALAWLPQLQAASERMQTASKRHEIVTFEDQVAPPIILFDGWAYQYDLLADGRRQVVTIWVPGDVVCNARTRGSGSMTAITTLTDTHYCVLRAASDTPESAEWVDDLLTNARAWELSLLENSVMRLGRLTAFERLSHLFSEIYERLSIVGKVGSDGGFAFPLTQELMADALGLSVVHVNRTLQQMRAEHLVEVAGGVAAVPDIDALRDAAGLCSEHFLNPPVSASPH